MSRFKTLLLGSIFLASCVSVPEDAGFSNLVELTAPMLPAPAEWVGKTVTEQQAEDRIRALLSEPLNEASVAEITVLSNRDLRSVLYGLQAARGDYRDAASLPNPFVSALFVNEVGVRELTDCFGNVSTTSTPMGGALGFSYDILDLVFLPRTLKAAKAEFNAAQYGSVRQFSDITHKARLQFYEAVAAQQLLNLAEQGHRAAEASASTASALYDAGNIAKVQQSREQLFEAQMRAQMISAQRRYDTAMRELSLSMGLDTDLAKSVKLEGRLRNPDASEMDALDLSTIMNRNLELRHRKSLYTAAGKRMGLTTAKSFIGEAEVEFERERHDGEYEDTFGIGFELPIFNFGGGRREASRARMEMMRQSYEGRRRALVTTSDILYGELGAAREAVLLQRREILPLSKQVLDGTQLDYNAMQIGVFDLLDAKRRQLDAGAAYIDALKDYWSTRARYEYLLAGGSPSMPDSAPGADMMTGGSTAGGDH